MAFHQCSVCDKQFYWDNNSSWFFQVVDKGFKGYEITIKLCSKKCKEDSKVMIPFQVNTKNPDKNITYDINRGIWIYKNYMLKLLDKK